MARVPSSKLTATPPPAAGSAPASRLPCSMRMPRPAASSCRAWYSRARLMVWLTVPSASRPPLLADPSRRPVPLSSTLVGVGKPAASTGLSAPTARRASSPLLATVR